jgi:hypothetical protein
MELLPYNLTDPETEVDGETFQYFHSKFAFSIPGFNLECKTLSVEVKIFSVGPCMMVFHVFRC